jgi:hypothetical protein
MLEDLVDIGCSHLDLKILNSHIKVILAYLPFLIKLMIKDIYILSVEVSEGGGYCDVLLLYLNPHEL